VKAIDSTIVELLQQNARITNRALAEAINLAPSTTLGHVAELERSGVITGYHASVDLRSLGRGVQALVFVKLRPKTSGAVAEFVNHIWKMDSVVGIHFISGADDALVHVAVGSTEELRKTVLDDISSLPMVVDQRTSIIFEHRVKSTVVPIASELKG
jgi:DNA-binding Lrp family transcriptional regulator